MDGGGVEIAEVAELADGRQKHWHKPGDRVDRDLTRGCATSRRCAPSRRLKTIEAGRGRHAGHGTVSTSVVSVVHHRIQAVWTKQGAGWLDEDSRESPGWHRLRRGAANGGLGLSCAIAHARPFGRFPRRHRSLRRTHALAGWLAGPLTLPVPPLWPFRSLSAMRVSVSDD